MKIYDFDAKFFEYAQTWMALHPGLTEKQAEESYNEIMLNFLNAPAKWLDGQKPGEYFQRYALSASRETPIKVASLGNDAGIIGSAYVALRAAGK